MPSVKIDALPKNTLKLTITVPADEVRPYMEEAAARLSETAKIPGFRPGKAGYDIVKQRLGEMKILEEALEPIVRKTYTEAIMGNKLETVGSPHIDVEKLVPGNDVVFTAEVARMPAVTRLADYRKIKVAAKPAAATDADVEQALNDLRRMQTKEVRAKAGVQASGTDKVVISIDMKKGNVPVEGGQSPNHSVYLGEEHYIPGMKDQIAGLKEGDKKSFVLPFPKDHTSKHLAGTDVGFDIAVKEIYHLETPGIDDAFAAALGQKDLATMKGLIKGNLEKEKIAEEGRRVEKELLEKVAADSRFEDIPDLLLNEEINKMTFELQRAVEEQGLDFDAYLQNIKKTIADLKMDFTPQALMRIKVALLLKEIFKKENLQVEGKEIDEELDELASRYEDKETKLQIYSPTYRDYIETMLKNRKSIKFLTDAALQK